MPSTDSLRCVPAATSMAVIPVADRYRRFDRARQMLADGHAVGDVARFTGLSNYLLGILALPEEALREIVAEDAEEQRARSFAASRERKQRERELQEEERRISTERWETEK